MPITVGALTNVPAPNDPIRSPWAQQASGYVVHPFASLAALNANWGSAPNGSIALALDTGIVYTRRAGVWRPPPGTVISNSAAQQGDIAFTTAGLRDLFVFGPGVTYNYPTLVTFSVAVYFGFASGQSQAQIDLVAMATGASVATSAGGTYAAAAQYQTLALMAAWSIPAGADASGKCRINVIVPGGTCHTSSSVSALISAA